MIMFDEGSGKLFDVPDDVIAKFEMNPQQVQELRAAMKASAGPDACTGSGDVEGYWEKCWTRRSGSFEYGGRTFSWKRRTWCIGGRSF